MLEVDLSTISIYSFIFENLSIKVSKIQESVQAINVDPNTAAILQVSPSNACFLISRIVSSYDTDGPIEYVETILRGDKYMFIYDVEGKDE